MGIQLEIDGKQMYEAMIKKMLIDHGGSATFTTDQIQDMALHYELRKSVVNEEMVINVVRLNPMFGLN